MSHSLVAEMTTMIMVYNKDSDEVLVIDRLKKYPGLSFPGGEDYSACYRYRKAVHSKCKRHKPYFNFSHSCSFLLRKDNAIITIFSPRLPKRVKPVAETKKCNYLCG